LYRLREEQKSNDADKRKHQDELQHCKDTENKRHLEEIKAKEDEIDRLKGEMQELNTR